MYIHILFTFEERRGEVWKKNIRSRRTSHGPTKTPLLLPSSLKRTILRREYRYQREGRQVRRLLLLRYLLLHPRKRNSSVIAPQIPVNKYFCIGIRLPPFYLASVLSYLSPSRVRRRRTLIPERRVVSRRAPQRDLSARLSIGARWKRGLTSSSSLYDSS